MGVREEIKCVSEQSWNYLHHQLSPLFVQISECGLERSVSGHHFGLQARLFFLTTAMPLTFLGLFKSPL